MVLLIAGLGPANVQADGDNDKIIAETIAYVQCLTGAERAPCSPPGQNSCVTQFAQGAGNAVLAMDAGALVGASQQFVGCLDLGNDCLNDFADDLARALPNLSLTIGAIMDFLSCLFGINHVPEVEGTFSLDAKAINGHVCSGTLTEVYESESSGGSDGGGGGVEVLMVELSGEGSRSWERSSTSVTGIKWDYECGLFWDSSLYASNGNYRRAETYWVPGNIVARACEYQGQPVGASYCNGVETGSEPGDILVSSHGYDHWEADGVDWTSNIPNTATICVSERYKFYAASYPSLGVGYSEIVRPAEMLGDFAGGGCNEYPINWDWSTNTVAWCTLGLLGQNENCNVLA